MRGKFVTFEGCEGAGKTTQVKLLCDYLTTKGVDFIMTREPGGSRIAEDIRRIILNKDYGEMSDECEALLYAAARIQHLKEIVEPALAAGKLVICDRYVDSSFAYQGYARGLGYSFVKSINSYALKNYSPDLTIFLDISPIDAFKRKNGPDTDDRIEQQGAEFHQKVYDGYKSLLEKYPRIWAIDCNRTAPQVAKDVRTLLRQREII